MKLSARNGRWNYDNRTMAGEENEWLEKKQRSFRPFVPVYWLETRSRNESPRRLKLEIFDRKRALTWEEELMARSTSRELIPLIEGEKRFFFFFLV